MIMELSKIIVNAFFMDKIISRRKVICVFDKNVSKEEMKQIIMEYLKENEYDDIDDSAKLHTAEELEEAAERIVNGGIFARMDSYYIDDVEMYVQN